MKRIAFTIIYNGLHHLEHLGFWQFMVENFDYWVVIEGHARPNGSTKWCKRVDTTPRSSDGTHEFMVDLASKYDNIRYYSPGRYWLGKDLQVNKAMEIITGLCGKCYLWEVDADEIWTSEKLKAAEDYADRSVSDGFSFQFNHFVGENLIASGDWGSGTLNRLWKWRGQYFRSHEPALLVGQRSCEFIEGIKFDHYSYYFEKDVAFKSKYYSGHELVYDKWKQLQLCQSFPVHISSLFGLHNKIGKSNSLIHAIHPN